MDDCYCRGDLQPVAHDLLSSCIDQLCSVGDNSVILATAASIYSGYCTARGLKASPAQNTADTTSQSGFSAPTTPSIQFGSTSSSSTSPSNTQSPSSASTNNTMKVALGSLGGVTVIALVVAAICCWKIRRKKMSAKPAPYYLDPMTNSSHQLYPSGGMQLSNGAPEIGPSDSASQMGQPSLMGPSYPPQSDPSVLSTTISGSGGSMLGPRRNAPNQRYAR
ncbi:hypothetical protein V500_02249 [Pseudogymnoascus sp. VKM F-4518 (FW-2643)]|nr:hypothetical protein V500_02249 [Pseudogymnoascus sp. VKM F-4518 (FW-2643)]